MSEANKASVRAYVEAFNAGSLEKLRACHTPDAVVRGVLGWGAIDEVVPIWRDLIECLSINLRIESLIAEGEILAARFHETGRSIKPFRGQPATGKSYELFAMEWYEMKNGLIHRRWGARDAASQVRQLGWT